MWLQFMNIYQENKSTSKWYSKIFSTSWTHVLIASFAIIFVIVNWVFRACSRLPLLAWQCQYCHPVFLLIIWRGNLSSFCTSDFICSSQILFVKEVTLTFWIDFLAINLNNFYRSHSKLTRVTRICHLLSWLGQS